MQARNILFDWALAGWAKLVGPSPVLIFAVRSFDVVQVKAPAGQASRSLQANWCGLEILPFCTAFDLAQSLKLLFRSSSLISAHARVNARFKALSFL